VSGSGGVQAPREDAAARLRLTPLSEGMATWRSLLAGCPEVTLYHRERWIELLGRAHRLGMWLATLERDGRVAAGGVFARSPNPFVKRFVALPFSDSAPPLARSADDARELAAALIEQGDGAAYEIRGLDCGEKWERVGCFVSWRLQLWRPLQALERGLGINFRRNLRRAGAVRVEHGAGADYLRRFYALQLDSRRHFGVPPQPWRFFELVHGLFAPANLDIWLAKEAGKDVAAAVFVRDGDAIYFKWGARRANCRSNANHRLLWSAVEEFAPHARVLELGRSDVRNQGLMQFKRGLGATATALPYSFFPMAPRQVSPEVLGGAHRLLAMVWRRLPIFATRMLGRVAYRFLA